MRAVDDGGLPSRALLQEARGKAEPRLERAIGVIYLPESERVSHYFFARLPDQFDAVLHFDRTRAVEPLEINSQWSREDVPETYPSAL
jgi:erythromycin esterase-like protein